MAINFPNNPSNSDTFDAAGVTFVYNSTKGTWTPQNPSDTYVVTANDVIQYESNLTIDYTQLTNTPAEYVVTANDVIQYQSNLTIDYTQLTNTPAAYVVTANDVTQHESSLTIDYTQLTNTPTDVDDYIRLYRYDDTLAINTGTTRMYIHDSYTLVSVKAYVDTAPVGSSVILDIKKNGSSLQNITIADGASSGSNTTLNHSVVDGDYLTVDITQIGSSTAGENLFMVFTFN